MTYAIRNCSSLAALLFGLGLATAPVSGHAQIVDQPTAAAHTQAASDLAVLLTDYETWLRQQDPISSGMEGDLQALARLPDYSRAGELAEQAPLEVFAARAAALDPETFRAEDRLNLDLLQWTLARRLRGIALDTGRLAFSAEGGPGQGFDYLARTTRITTLEEANAWLARLEAMPAAYAQQLENARRGLATGMVQPRSTVQAALILMDADLARSADTDALLAPTRSLPATLPEAERHRLQARAEAIVTEQIMPQRQAWAAFLRRDYLPTAPESLGLGNRPGGRDAYAFYVNGFTTTDLTPEQIHQIGLDEVARIRVRMEQEMVASGWTGDFASFLAFLRSDPQFYAQTREDLLEKASEMAKRADAGLPPLFNTLPRTPYGVIPVPAAIEAGYTTGRYSPGALKNGVAGNYLVNTYDLSQRPLYELPALTLHEAVPGHHLQIALQQEAAEQPYFRRNIDVTAFIEGWGLYAEYLGEEMGFYRTPYERFGRLSYEMWRACRLVADTGLHWMGWSLEQARTCFRDNSALSPLNIETELQRYIGWPGQATAYKIGEIRLRQIRERAEAALGARFNVRRFHDALLVDGPLPLDLLDRRMDRWITEEQARPAP